MPRELPHVLADRPGLVGILEEELAVARDPVAGDLIGRDARGIDERHHQAGAAPREDAVELGAPGQRLHEASIAGHVEEVFRCGGDEGVEPFGIQYPGQAVAKMSVHERLL